MTRSPAYVVRDVLVLSVVLAVVVAYLVALLILLMWATR